MITIVNYGLGNLGSIQNMLRRLGISSVITCACSEIGEATKIILPGVGHFARAMERIDDLGLREVLEKKAMVDKVPILGICLGMQLLTRASEEGNVSGLAWIPAHTRRFKFHDNGNYKVPHMGWNNVIRSSSSPLTDGFDETYKFYFVHSYYVEVENQCYSILKTKHGFPFDSAIQKDNIFGVQFHPEKSHKYGLRILENFCRV